MLRRGAKPSREAPAAAVSNGLKSGLGSRIVREDKEVNNTTEHEYMRSMFADLMTTMPITPVPERPERIGRQPQGSDGCHLIVAANNADIAWSTFFNKKDSEGCAARYQVGALMEARPNGIIFGRKLIQMFWASVHSGDPGPIRYSNTRMRVVDEDTVTFCSDWTFNTMGGIIMLESWRRLKDGKFELDEDRFKIVEVYPSPRVVSPEEEVAGLAPLHAINGVMSAMAKRIDAFNAGDLDGYAKCYAPDAKQMVDPIANNNGREQIKKYMSSYIQKRKSFGNSRLTCNNFSVKVFDANHVHVSGDWDLGGRDNEGSLTGFMNLQRYVKQPDGKWLVDLDDFTIAPTEMLY